MARKLPTLTLEQCDYLKWLTVKEATEFFGWKDVRTTLKRCNEKKLLFIRIGSEYRIPVFEDEYNSFLQQKEAKGNSDEQTENLTEE